MHYRPALPATEVILVFVLVATVFRNISMHSLNKLRGKLTMAICSVPNILCSYQFQSIIFIFLLSQKCNLGIYMHTGSSTVLICKGLCEGTTHVDSTHWNSTGVNLRGLDWWDAQCWGKWLHWIHSSFPFLVCLLIFCCCGFILRVELLYAITFLEPTIWSLLPSSQEMTFRNRGKQINGFFLIHHPFQITSVLGFWCQGVEVLPNLHTLKL